MKQKFWLTKVKEFADAHKDDIISQAVSPCGTTIATVGLDETISLFKMFEKKKVNLNQGLRLSASQATEGMDVGVS